MAGNITVQRSGARTVELFIPYEFQGIRVEAISLGPYLFDHTLRWRKGAFEDMFAMMVELSCNVTNGKPMRADDLRQLRYPDADRVLDNFVELLPAEIRQAIAGNYWPTHGSVASVASAPADQSLMPNAPGGGGGMQPDHGLDIGDD